MEFYVYETNETIAPRSAPSILLIMRRNCPTPSCAAASSITSNFDEETMRAIIEVHFPGLKGKLVSEALNIFYEIRDVPGLKKALYLRTHDWWKLLLPEDVSPETLRKRTRRS